MKLTWYGHSCFHLESADGSLVFDPYEPGSVPGLSLPSLKADRVLCSHGHHDHCYAEGVTLSGREFCGSISTVSCFHDDCGGRKRGENLITLVDAEGFRLVHLGDLGHMLSAAQLKSLGRVDILLVPVGGFYTIGPEAAAELVKLLSPAVTVPMHYRGKGFGYSEIENADKFLSLCENICYYNSSSIELSAPLKRQTAVLQCPAKT